MINKIFIVDADSSVLSKELKKSLDIFFSNIEVKILSLKWTKSKKNPLLFFKTYLSFLLKINRNDLVIVFSPLIIFFPLLLFSRSIKICLYFDFFPIHQIQLNKIDRFKKVLYNIERYLFTKTIYGFGLMSDRNIEFAKDYFIANDARLFKVPLWSTKTPTRTTYLKINQNVKFKVFFGGQLIAGRNIPFLITFIKHIVSKYKNYEFNIFGSGVYESEFKNLSNSHKDVIFHGKKSYDDFFIKIQDYDIGLVFTNLDTTIPSYPSKSLDMLCSGIPILGVSEESSDFSSIINNSGSGEIINANDIEILTKKLELIKFNYSQYSKNAVKFYNKSHFFKNSLKNLKNIINEIK